MSSAVTSRRKVAISASASGASLSSAISVASTLAPSAAKANAAARPIPCAAAVTNARLPASRPAIARNCHALHRLVNYPDSICRKGSRVFPHEKLAIGDAELDWLFREEQIENIILS